MTQYTSGLNKLELRFPLQCPTEIHNEEESDPDDDIPLAQLIRVVRQRADSNELISFEEMFDIEESTKSANVKVTMKVMTQKWTIRHTGSEYSHEDMLRNITHMINFGNTKDNHDLKFLLPMQSMTEDTIVRRKMVKKPRNN